MQTNPHISCIILAAAFVLGGCDGRGDLDERDDGPALLGDASPNLDDGPSEREHVLSSDEIAAIQAERRIASLSAPGGRIDIVDAGSDGEPAFVYVSIGSPSLGELLGELVEEQGATPAEVFLSLTEEGAELPDALLADHRARVDEGIATRTTPQRLHYASPRALDLDNLDCFGGGNSPQSFGSWVDEWEDRFRFLNTRVGFETSDRNTADGTDIYTVGGDTDGRVLSACNISVNDPTISYWVYNTGAGPQFIPFWADSLDRYQAVHFHSFGWGLPYQMAVSHNHPDPDTYVAVGRCGNNC